jgi:hypothetical protein
VKRATGTAGWRLASTWIRAQVVTFGLAALLLPMTSLAEPAEAVSFRLVYEAVGPQAPQRIAVEKWPGLVRLLDDSGRPFLVFDSRAGILTLLDHEAATYRRLDETGMRTLVEEASVAFGAIREYFEQLPEAERAGQQRGLQDLMSLRGPWQSLGAADDVVETGETAPVAGFSCRLLRFLAGTQHVGTACVVDPETIPGTDAIVAMFSEMNRIGDALAVAAPPPWPPAWPGHPLALASWGRWLPLQVVESPPGERRHELRLSLRETLADPEPPEAVPSGFRAATSPWE